MNESFKHILATRIGHNKIKCIWLDAMAITQFKSKGFLTTATGNPATGQRAVKDLPFLEATFKASLIGQEDIHESIDGSCTPSTVATINNGTNWEAEFKAESITSRVIEMAMGEEWKSSSGYDYYPSFTKVIPASGVITDTTNLPSTLTPADVSVSIINTGTYGPGRPLNVLATGSATSSAVVLNAASGTLTFAVAYQGAVVKYTPKKTLSSVYTIGVEDVYNLLTAFRFIGEFCSTDNERIIIDTNLQAVLEPEFKSGAKPDISLKYKCVALSGARSVLKWISVPPS